MRLSAYSFISTVLILTSVALPELSWGSGGSSPGPQQPNLIYPPANQGNVGGPPGGQTNPYLQAPNGLTVLPPQSPSDKPGYSKCLTQFCQSIVDLREAARKSHVVSDYFNAMKAFAASAVRFSAAMPIMMGGATIYGITLGLSHLINFALQPSKNVTVVPVVPGGNNSNNPSNNPTPPDQNPSGFQYDTNDSSSNNLPLNPPPAPPPNIIYPQYVPPNTIYTQYLPNAQSNHIYINSNIVPSNQPPVNPPQPLPTIATDNKSDAGTGTGTGWFGKYPWEADAPGLSLPQYRGVTNYFIMNGQGSGTAPGGPDGTNSSTGGGAITPPNVLVSPDSGNGNRNGNQNPANQASLNGGTGVISPQQSQ